MTARFDQVDRDRIRRALLRYMEENRIGVPTLHKLIAEANDRSLDYVPLKTLQRFLADTHRTNDVMVRFCHVFAHSLPDDDPLSDLGEALVSFCGVTVADAKWRAPPPDMIGSFASRTAPSDRGLTVSQGNLDGWIPFSRMSVSRLPALPFAAVQETITNWRAQSRPDTDPDVRRVYEGVLFLPPGVIFVLMRNVLTGTPRLYWLVEAARNRLWGNGHESYGPLDEVPATLAQPFKAERVLFERQGTEAAS